MNYNSPRMMSIPKAAKELGLSEFYLRNAVLAVLVKAVRVNKKFLVNIDSALEWLNSTVAESNRNK